MIVPFSSTSWHSPYCENIERTVRKKNSVVRCHMSSWKYSDNRLREYSTICYGDIYRSSAQQKTLPSSQGTESIFLLPARQTPCEVAPAGDTARHALQCHETVFCCGCKNVIRLAPYHIMSIHAHHSKKSGKVEIIPRSCVPRFFPPPRTKKKIEIGGCHERWCSSPLPTAEIMLHQVTYL